MRGEWTIAVSTSLGSVMHCGRRLAIMTRDTGAAAVTVIVGAIEYMVVEVARFLSECQ